MDIEKQLKNINSLNEYIAVSQNALQKFKMSKIELSLPTVHALKKIRSLEIEHVNKCEESGIACVIFERMLCWPPSTTWRIVSKELVILLQYWLEAVRKHLVKHSPHWWTFLKLLLKFTKELGQKHISIPEVLVEHTSECLFDLATNDKPDAMQKFEILHCLNIYSSQSTKELRFTLRTKYLDYFTKLGVYMCHCGHLPTQYSIIETLLRWLLPRKDPALRIASATKWFPARLYSEEVVDIFIARPWTSFLRDARDMLNKHNNRGDLITSIVCRKLSIGDIVIIPNSDEIESWLDVNSASRSLSVLLGPHALEKFGCPYHRSFEMIYISDDNTHTANLYRESQRLVLSVQTITPPQIMPSCIKLGDNVSCHVTIVVTSRCDVTRLDGALRNIFDNKYQMIMDLKKGMTPPIAAEEIPPIIEEEIPPTAAEEIPVIAAEEIPPIITEEQKIKIESMLNNLRNMFGQSQVKETEDLNKNNESEEQAGSSHLAIGRFARDTGYKTLRLRQPLSCMSPSTASTSSLAQLHEKLAALPRHKFDKETEWTCAAPDLSVVTEVSEPDDHSTSTIEYRAYGARSKNKYSLDRSRRSQSDNETIRKYPGASRKGKKPILSPLVHCITSCSLPASTGESANDSVINDTVEKIHKPNDIDTLNVDLLYQEAMQASQEKNKDKTDSGINTQENKWQDVNVNSDAIENTLNDNEIKCQPKRKSKVIFSTSDESNTEAISDTPNVYVTTRRSKKNMPKVIYDCNKMVEEFFSQDCTENKDKGGDIVISPKLARKMNETSSEDSDDLQGVEPCDFNNIEVLECLNNIVDKVCDDFDKCTKYLNKEQDIVVEDNNSDLEDNVPLKEIMNQIQNYDSSNKTTTKTPKAIKLKYKVASKKPRTTNQKNKLEIESTSIIPTIIEDNIEVVAETSKPKLAEEDLEKNNKNSLPRDTNVPTTPVLRRKRKLFSPKDEQMPEETSVLSQTEENYFMDCKIKKTPKTTATYKPYKDLENERKRVRKSRNRKSNNAAVQSPRSKKMNDLFNKVKESANGEHVTLANKASDLDVYNFSTDSEDNFKEKKIDITKKTSTTTLDSVESTVLRRGRVVKRVNYPNTNNAKNTKRKVNKRQNTKKKINIEPRNDLVDERIRETKEALETSMVVEDTRVVVVEPELILEKPPEMEIINVKEERSYQTRQKTRRTRKNKGKPLESDKGVKNTLNIIHVDNNRTESPLPGLVVEEAPASKTEDGDLSSNMVDKFKRICQNPEKYINESNTTQNLLSDNDRNIYSPQTIEITDDLMKVEPQINIEKKPKGKVSQNNKTNSVKGRKSKTKIQAPAESVEIVPGIETKSDLSIATVGITGHGDSEEAPPSPKLIIETLEHRNLETEYLDNSTKDYFDKLTEEINDINDICRNDSNERNYNRTINKTDEAALLDDNINNDSSPKYSKSPVVSIERISLADISRWLPSRRNSDSDYNSPSSSKSKPKSKDFNRIAVSPKVIETKKNSDDEPEIQEAIRRSLRKAYEKSPVFKINNSGASKKSQNINYDSDDSVKSIRITRTVKAKTPEKVTRVLPPRRVKCTPQSIISPIKLFDDLISNADKLSQTTLSDDEEYMNEIKETLYKQIQKAEIYEEEPVKELKSAKKNVKEILNKSIQQKISTRSIDLESRSNSKILKRGLEVDRDAHKKQKVEDNNNVGDITSAASAATASSVDDWFKRSQPGSSRAEEFNVLTKDSIQTVIEKLDTTLIEIHQNTSNKFVHLFVSAQQQLRELKQERQKLYKRVAGDVLAGLVTLIDDKFADLDNRSQEQDSNFMKRLKEQASAVIREDLKQKRVMVQLLKEDVLAVVEHVARNTE